MYRIKKVLLLSAVQYKTSSHKNFLQEVREKEIQEEKVLSF